MTTFRISAPTFDGDKLLNISELEKSLELSGLFDKSFNGIKNVNEKISEDNG